MQPSLFEPASGLLVDDARGTITYIADAVAPSAAAAWFAALRDGVDWGSERRLMYEREVDVPRLMASFRLDQPGLPPALADAACIARRLAGCEFNSAGLNYYRDGRDSVAPHNDKLHEIVRGAPIALLSLGATRRMTIRTKARPGSTIQLELEPGSLLVMSWETQRHFDHGIPKVRGAEPRISVAFRVRPLRRAHSARIHAPEGK
jgi:alkylated DNA repair dioxygenase AlkB